MKRFIFAAFLASFTLLIPACGGGGSSSSASNQTHEGGLAPEKLTSDMYLTPVGFDRGGRIWLEGDSVRTAHFSSERDANGNYVNSGWTQGRNAYTGNYTYTKCAPDIAELRVENLRAEAQDTADDCIWTVIGYLHFYRDANGKDRVSFTGTETLVGSHNGNTDFNGEGHNDPLGYSATNHFPGTQHSGGGSRNFASEYAYTMGN